MSQIVAGDLLSRSSLSFCCYFRPRIPNVKSYHESGHNCHFDINDKGKNLLIDIFLLSQYISPSPNLEGKLQKTKQNVCQVLSSPPLPWLFDHKFVIISVHVSQACPCFWHRSSCLPGPTLLWLEQLFSLQLHTSMCHCHTCSIALCWLSDITVHKLHHRERRRCGVLMCNPSRQLCIFDTR